MLYFDIFGRTADSSVPVFIALENEQYWDRLAYKLYGTAELKLLFKRKKNWPFEMPEVGLAPEFYRAAYPNLPYLEISPPAPPEVPDVTWSKGMILMWLRQRGVLIEDASKLSVVELLSFIDDMQDTP